MKVYFAQSAVGEGPIKIGVSKDPLTRLKFMSGYTPHTLQLLASIAGDNILERRFHAAFEADHYHHEWFWPSEKLLETVGLINQGLFNCSALPKPKMLCHRVNGATPPRGGWKWSKRS